MSEFISYRIEGLDKLQTALTLAPGRFELALQRTLIKTAQAVMKAENSEMERSFDRPTRFTLNADGRNPGGPLYDNAITWRWRATRDAAGLSVRLHSLRHFYASGLIAAGCDVVTVQRAMGHATATTTLNTYSHLWPTAEDRTRAAASDLAKAILAPGTRPVEPKQGADLRRLS